MTIAAARVKKQGHARGGWRYNPNDGNSDLSLSGWQLMSLHAAQQVGIPVDEDVVKGAVEYAKRLTTSDGKVGYEESDVDFSNRTPDFEMLFDLEADPKEMNNLVDSQAHSDILKTLRSKCAAHSQALDRQRQDFKNAVQTERR